DCRYERGLAASPVPNDSDVADVLSFVDVHGLTPDCFVKTLESTTFILENTTGHQIGSSSVCTALRDSDCRAYGGFHASERHSYLRNSGAGQWSIRDRRRVSIGCSQ